VVTFQVDEDTEVVIRGGERGELADLAPGKVVRIQYQKTPQGNQADRIEELLDSTEMR
jgi:cold shock CspA family protein